MDCPESGRVVAFLDGALEPAETSRFDEHLLTCEECWQAVAEDRAGRAAAASLREPASSVLEDRIRLAVSLANAHATPHSWHRHVPHRAAVVGAAMAAGVFAWLGVALSSGPSARNPAPISMVLTLAEQRAPTAALLAGESMIISGHQMTVHAYVIHGVQVLAATSATPFAMPVEAHIMTGSSPLAWMATSGSMSLYGVNHGRNGPPSMFVVSAMPMAELPQVAAELKLI